MPPASARRSLPLMDEAVAHFLELRLRVRRNPEARATVDRCLLILAKAQTADAEGFAALQDEIQALGDELAMRFGAPATVSLH